MILRSLQRPLALVGLAIVLYGVAIIVSTRHNPKPLVLPVPLQAGQVVSPSFRVDQALPYLVELEVDRALPFEQLRCLLGETSIATFDCAGFKQVVDLRWRVLDDRRVVASGESAHNQGAGYGPTIAKIIGSFDGLPGKEYTLEVTVVGDMSALRAANPRVVVQLHPIDTKGNYVTSALLQLIALLCTAIGLVWLALIGYRRAFSKRGA